jgi:hypothetical protein
MRRGIAIVALLFVILAGVGIGVGAYRAGERKGIAEGVEQVQTAQANGQEVQVVHVVDGGPYFFPGFFLFPLLLFGAFFIIGGIFRGAGRWGGRPGHRHGPGPWNDEGRRRLEERAQEWHRAQHGEAPAPPPAAS